MRANSEAKGRHKEMREEGSWEEGLYGGGGYVMREEGSWEEGRGTKEVAGRMGYMEGVYVMRVASHAGRMG